MLDLCQMFQPRRWKICPQNRSIILTDTFNYTFLALQPHIHELIPKKAAEQCGYHSPGDHAPAKNEFCEINTATEGKCWR